MIFRQLQVWIDPVRRDGPEAMAVDEWLLETAVAPVLRVYQWDGEWASLGYFGALEQARNSLPGVNWVRRWTGGGVVDHRSDWTYSVVAPSGEVLATRRGAESYRWIHEALLVALQSELRGVCLSAGEAQTGAAMCFDNPVSHDLVAADGRKLAGAGQRRTRHGLLHQGSVALACAEVTSPQRAESLAAELAADWHLCDFLVPTARISDLVGERYANDAWTRRQ